MATATSSTFSPYDRSAPSLPDNPPLSTQSGRFATTSTKSTPPQPGQHLDDADLLAWKRQYANISSREQNAISNSAEDLSQLDDRIPYQFEVFDHDYNDMDDDEIHFDNGAGYDYETAIQERLRKANAEFEHDVTSAELKQQQRVSFDAVVKAVDIVQDPQEYSTVHSIIKSTKLPVIEEPLAIVTDSQVETNPHQYNVPLNDTQPKEGPTLLQQLKAMQFHGVLPTGERWSPQKFNPTDDKALHEENPVPSKPNQNTTTDSDSLQKSMVVAINGGFELQDEDDYTAKHSTNGHSSKSQDHDDERALTTVKKLTFAPTPPADVKGEDNSPRSQAPHRSFPPIVRPTSSDPVRQTDNSTSATATKAGVNDQARAKSASVSKTPSICFIKPSSGVDYAELNRKAAEKKRAELQEERRKQDKAKEARKIELEKAKESFEKWIRDKDAERKRLNEEKRMEKEAHEARQIECTKELTELREKRYREWIERKDREVVITHEFKKMQASDEELISGESSSSNSQNHRAFHRWLRRKYEQSKEETRVLHREQRRLRRRQRRSIKRFQLQQDLQLAKSFGYS